MRKSLFLLLLLTGFAYGQHTFCPTDGNCTITGTQTYAATPNYSLGLKITPIRISALPASPTAGQIEIVSNGSSSSDCTSGGGTNQVTCTYNGSAWTASAGGSGSGTVNSGTAYQAATYGANGTTVKGVPTEYTFSSAGLFGEACDGSTDDTTAFNTAMTALYNAGGGALKIVGTCVLNSAQITLPNNAAGSPTQPNIRIYGLGSSFNGYWSTPPATKSTLLLNFNATTAKIITLGAGTLEIDHLTLQDSSSDCAPFILTTNTTLQIHDDVFIGTASGTSACNDAITLGGASSTTVGGLTTSPFQGYGTVIEKNFFHKMRRLVYGRVYANAMVIRDNANSTGCGSSATDGAPYEFDSSGAAGNNNVGVVLEGNLVEGTAYKHIVNCQTCSKSTIIGNNSYDESASWVSAYHMGETTGGFNVVLQGMNTDAKPAGDGTDWGNSGATTFIASHQGVQSYFASQTKYSFVGGSIPQISYSSSPNSWDVLRSDTSDEWYTVFASPNEAHYFNPLGAGAVNWYTWHYYGANQYSLQINGSSAAYIEFPNGDGKIKVKTGSTLWLGDESGQSCYVQQSVPYILCPTFKMTGSVPIQDSSGNSAYYILRGNLTTTAATSDAVTINGTTSSSVCSLTATNATAATNIATTYISTKAANTITVTHTATASMTYDLLCTK